MAHLSISLFGSTKVTLAGQLVTHFRSDKVLALLVYLAVEAERPHRRETLAGLLWPDQPEAVARHNLSQSLLRLRRAIGDKEASPPFLLATRQTIQFNPRSDYLLDVAAFLKQLEAKANPAFPNPADEVDVQALHQAAELYRGHFLEHFFLADSDLFEEWALSKRERLRQLALSALGQLIDYHEQQSHYELAGHYARRQVELDSIREETHRRLMWLLMLNGQRNAALAQYAACRRILADELGVEPAAETVALYEQIRSGELNRKAEEQAERLGRRGAGEKVSPLPPRASAPRHDWGGAPDVSHFYGRKTELAQLRQWLVTDRCRLAVILGIGGQGKTALVAKAAKESEGQFDAVIWRSLLNAPPLAEILESWLRILSRQQLITLPQSLDQQLSLLFEQLRRQRCLLILDNAESLMQGGQRAGEYRPGYESYGQLVRRFGESEHQSCLLLTSRERPREFTTLERKRSPVRSLQLTGLDPSAGQAILQEEGLTGSIDTTQALINRYSGNPLALILVADTVQELFGGDISAFLSDEAAIFEDIQDVLNQQFGRLTALEQALMVWLAIEREPVSIQTLADNLVPTPGSSQLLEAIRSLQRRSLIEKHGEGWSSQNVVIEYVTDRLVRRVCQEIEHENLDWFNRHALIKAQAREYVRQSQERLILKPVAEWLASHYGPAGVKARLARLLEQVRAGIPLPPGYTGGNMLNLLLYLNIDCRGWNFLGLTVWQAYLQDKTLQEVNLAGADLRGSEFTDTFGTINDITCSPDGQLLAGATANNQIRLWQAASGRPVASLAGHTEFVNSVTFSPDGALLASGSGDLTTCVWDVQTGQRLKTFQVHTAYVSTVAFSPDGVYLASAGIGCLSICDLRTDEILALRFDPARRIETVAFSPDGRNMAVNFEETIQVWDVAATLAARREQVCHTLRGHTALIWSFAFHPDGQVLASAARDQTIRLWNMDSGQCLATLGGHTGGVRAVAFSPDGKLLASGSTDQTIRLWDGQSGEALATLSGHRQLIMSLAFTPDGLALFSSSGDKTIGMWDTQSGQRLRTIQGYNNRIHTVAVSPDGEWCASGSEDGGVRLWDIRQGECFRTLWGHDALVRKVTFSPDRAFLASCGYDGTVRIWTTLTGQAINTMPASRRRVTDLAYSPDGRYLAGGGDDGLLRVWYAQTGQALHTLPHDKTISALAFHPGSEILVSATFDFNIYVWDVRTGRLIRTLTGHENEVWGFCFNEAGNILASSSDDATIRLWDAGTGQCQHILRGQTYWMQGLAFSPDGRLLAGASRDDTIWLWMLTRAGMPESDRPFLRLSGHLDTVASIAFNPVSGHLVSVSLDETIRLWDTQIGECMGTWRPPGPYAGMNIAGATGLTPTQRLALKSLGAVEL